MSLRVSRRWPICATRGGQQRTAAIGIWALLTLAGCHAILDIESATVRRDAATEPSCAEDPARCAEACSDDAQCPANQTCVDGRCRADGMDAGPDGGGDAEVDAAPQNDAEQPDAEPVPCTLTCDAKSRCGLVGGVPACVCAPGYMGEPGACTDIDECAQTDRGGCSPNADCMNTEGSRTCTCKEGFQDQTGDGRECLTRCASAGCDPNATCTIVEGEAKCQCTGAYSGDGKTCTYNPSCAALTCGVNTKCGLKAGSADMYECQCQSGYEPDAAAGAVFACKNIDECARSPSVCAETPNASCEDNVGGFNCPCVAGFRKNALGACEDIPDCPQGACAGGTCVDATGSYSCSCNSGYAPGADGKSCVDARNDCPAGACAGGTCNDGVNSYTCSCGPGYSVSADQKSCTEINECMPNPCKNSGVCSDRVNDFSCDCSGTGHIGKTCDMVSQGCSTGVGSPCSVGVGECANTGTYRCNAAGTALECSVAPKPKGTERCNGKDDDCDGANDQTFTTLNQTCFKGEGACRSQGVNVCTGDGSGVTCNAVAGTPAANDASCNNVDDDCSGGIDEDFVVQATSCGVGECANAGMRRCVGGAVQDTCVPRAPSAEICDGKDNDCANGVDNGFSVGATCSNGLLGECARGGIRVCTAGGGAACNAPSATGTNETCNGKDDDCDGTKDDGVPTTCKNEGTQFVCSMSTGATVEQACSNTTSCFNGACVGSCRYQRDFTCMSGNSWSCQQNGSYALSQTCSPSVPERCETRPGLSTSGRCVRNDPFVMCANGVESPSSDCTGSASRTYAAGAVVAQPFTPTENVRMTAIGARTLGASNCNAYLSIHNDSNGQPGTIMNATTYRGFNADSLNLQPLQSAADAATKLAANARYWLVARIGGSGSCTLQYSSTNVAAGPFRLGTAVEVIAPDNMSPGDTAATANGGEIKLLVQVQR